MFLKNYFWCVAWQTVWQEDEEGGGVCSLRGCKIFWSELVELQRAAYSPRPSQCPRRRRCCCSCRCGAWRGAGRWWRGTSGLKTLIHPWPGEISSSDEICWEAALSLMIIVVQSQYHYHVLNTKKLFHLNDIVTAGYNSVTHRATIHNVIMCSN